MVTMKRPVAFCWGGRAPGAGRSPCRDQTRFAAPLALSEEGGPARLLARAAGSEILAELSRMSGAPFDRASGGLAPWAQRRALEFMRTHLLEDNSLDTLAAEARLSPFHLVRMFKKSLGVPPRVYLTRLRLERASELSERC